MGNSCCVPKWVDAPEADHSLLNDFSSRPKQEEAMNNDGVSPVAATQPPSARKRNSCSLQIKQLEKIMAGPYLSKGVKGFRKYIADCQREIEQGDSEAAENAIEVLSMVLADEEKMIAAAFLKFDANGDHVLDGDEIKFMMDYLGFPCSDVNVKNLMVAMDIDSNSTISFEEFRAYVGSMGGCGRMFEDRKAQILRHSSSDLTSMDKETIRVNLMAAGIRETSQAYWQLTATPSELEAAAMLLPCQQEAIRRIRALARENHVAALPKLKERVTLAGFTEQDMFMALAWIRELAPIVIHIDLDKVGNFLKEDTHYRNQFETNSSGGLLKTDVRVKWEKSLFGPAYDEAAPSQRPKYGAQNICNDYRGVMSCVQYGDSYLVLKNVRLRSTLSPEDSSKVTSPKQLSVPDFYAHVLAEYGVSELKETLKLASGGAEKVGDSKKVIKRGWGKYKEAQIHGEVSLDKHVECLVVSERHRDRKDWVESIAKAHDWKLMWMNDMKVELEKGAEQEQMDPAKWQKKLDKFKMSLEKGEQAQAFVQKARDVESMQNAM